MTNFTKLNDGSWGLRSENASLEVGKTVTVAKRDGSKSEVVVTEIVSSKNGVQLARFEDKNSEKPRRKNCDCTDGCCDRRCKCDRECNCHGGNIYNC